MTGQLTPVRTALNHTSSLQPLVKDGLGALLAVDKGRIEEGIRASFLDSLDIDKAFQPANPGKNRWDYLLGYGPTGTVVALEPHSAKNDEIDTVIRKKAAAKQQLTGHLTAKARIVEWYWVASGTVDFADTERARRRLDQQGIKFVSKVLLAKHLPAVAAAPPKKKPKRKVK